MRLYVGNLSYETSEEELRQLFLPYGEPASVRIVTDNVSGRSKGFGFVELADDQAAQGAMSALNGKELRGRTITVSEARPRPARPGFGGPRGGGREGGGGGGRGDFGGGGGGRSGPGGARGGFGRGRGRF